MSAQLHGDVVARANVFSAHLALTAGVTVNIHAPTLVDLQLVVGKLQATEPANDVQPAAPRGQTAAQAAADNIPGTKARDANVGNVSASTSTPAGAPPAAAGSTSAGDEARVTYDDVKKRILSLSKVNPQLAKDTLAKFKAQTGAPVDHGTKLQLPDYAAFITAADETLLATAGAAK